MNNLAFQIYGTKKATPFQSVWDTRNTSPLGGELGNRAAASLPTDWSGTNLSIGGYTHNALTGSNTLPFLLSTNAGQSYQIICILSAGSTGSVVINFGGASSVQISVTTTIILTSINSTGLLSITPVEFTGNVSLSIKQSSSAANQIQLPITLASGKSVWIDWGDGQYSTANSTNIIPNRIHTYTTPGEYPVRVFGDDFSFAFGSGNTNDRLKIKSISSWGKLKFSSYSFFGCSNVTMSGITDIPDLTGLNNFQYLFGGCGNITTIGRINEWNTSSVTSMTNTFDGCGKFNSDISNWDVSNITNFSQMFINATSFNNGFASGIANQLPWNTSACTNMTSMFQNCTAFNSNLGTGATPWDVSKVNNFTSMFNGASRFNNGNEADITKSKINNWNIGGSVTSVSLTSMFQSASAFNRDISSWSVSKATSTSGMFASASAFNQNIGNWNVNNITNFQSMFQGASAFNNNGSSDIDNWDINTAPSANVNMQSMFSTTGAFNQPLNNWNTSEVTTMALMFGSSLFNNGLSSGVAGTLAWNTGKVTNMSSMFGSNSRFNQDISSWNVSNVTNMSSMFASATAFNQSLSNWERVLSPDTSTLAKVTNMTAMFSFAIAFNKNIGNWNVSNVSAFATGDISGMFYNATNFNNEGSGDIGNWQLKTTGTISMQNMFRNTAFNQNINAWNTVAVTNMASMFYDARVFNQPLNNWNVSNVTTMQQMFFGATAFNQNIGNWNVSNVTNFILFMNGKTPATYSSTNLDAIYNGWIVNGVKPNISSPLAANISFGTAKYTQAGKPGKDTLTSPVISGGYNWTITDGLLTVSETSNNGGLIRVTTNTNGFTTGTSVLVNVYGVTGTIAANGTWTALVISSTVIQLQGSTYDAAWTGGGNVILG